MATTKENKKTNSSKTKNKPTTNKVNQTASATKKANTKTVKNAKTTSVKKNNNTTQKSTKTSSKKTSSKTPAKTSTAKTNIKQTKKTVTPVKKTTPKAVKTPEVVKELHVEEEVIAPVNDTEFIQESNFEITSFLGANLSTAKTKAGKKSRRRHYIKDAAFFATIVSVLDLFAMLFIKGYPQLIDATPWLNYTITVALDFVLVFLFTYALDYLIVEDAIQKNS